MSHSTSAPLFTVIIATRNRAARLEMCLREYARQTVRNFEIVVVDNGSADATPATMARLCTEFPYVRYMRLPDNIGPLALNLAAEMASGMYLWRTDDDAHPESTDLFARLERYVAAHPQVDVLAGDTYDMTWQDDHRWFPGTVDASAVPDEGMPSYLFNGCSACIRRSTYRQVGGFWDVFHLEESDMCVKILLAGGVIRYHPSYRSTHYSTTTSADMRLRWKVMSTQIVRFQFKYMPLWLAHSRCAVIVSVQMLKGIFHRLGPMLLLEGYLGMVDAALHARRLERIPLTREQRRQCLVPTSVLNDSWRYLRNALGRRSRTAR